jgi:hypothetical protein
MSDISTRIVAIYRQFTEKSPPVENINEKSYLQILFDYKFLLKVMEGTFLMESEVGESVVGADLQKSATDVANSIYAMVRKNESLYAFRTDKV